MSNATAAPTGKGANSWLGMSGADCCGCLIVQQMIVPARAVLGEPSVTVTFPAGTTRTVTIPENKRTGDRVYLVADSRNPDVPALVFDEGEWENHLASARAGHLDFGDFSPAANLYEAFERVDQLDLTRIMQRLATPRGGSLPATQIKLGAELYRQYWKLMLLYPGERIVLTKLVDMFLDTHVLDTASWTRDCLRIAGRIIHHDPFFGMGDDDAQAELEREFAKTVRLYDERFDTVIRPNEMPTLGHRNPLDELVTA